MAILFLSTQNTLNKQAEHLLVSLKSQDSPFYFACPENSVNAGFASAHSFEFVELKEHGLLQYFFLKKFIKNHAITHIHVYDEKALNLARWLKKSFSFLKIIGEWHERVLTASDYSKRDLLELEKKLKKNNAYLYSLLQGKIKGKEKTAFDCFLVSSPELCSYLGKNYQLQNIVNILPYLPENNVLSLLKKSDGIFTYFAYYYGENALDLEIALQAMRNLILENLHAHFILCLENKEDMARIFEIIERLEKTPDETEQPENDGSDTMQADSMEQSEIYEKKHISYPEKSLFRSLIVIEKSLVSDFYPLCNCVLGISTDGEGDYPWLHKAWQDKKVLVASDLSVHTKLILAHSTDCALLYPRDDVQSLTRCMQKVLQDETLRNRLLANGRQKIGQNTAKNLADTYLGIVNRL